MPQEILSLDSKVGLTLNHAVNTIRTMDHQRPTL